MTFVQRYGPHFVHTKGPSTGPIACLLWDGLYYITRLIYRYHCFTAKPVLCVEIEQVVLHLE